VLSSSEQDIQALIHKINKSIVAPLPTMYSSALWVFCSIIILSYYPIIFLFLAFIQLIYLCPYLSMVGWCKHAYKQILTKLVMCNDHPIHSFIQCLSNLHCIICLHDMLLNFVVELEMYVFFGAWSDKLIMLIVKSQAIKTWQHLSNSIWSIKITLPFIMTKIEGWRVTQSWDLFILHFAYFIN
jgi:hypothetical protein